MAFFDRDWPGVVRSKGFFWLATRPDSAGSLSQAGGALTHEAAGLWWSAVPGDARPDDPGFAECLASVSRGDTGDRRQELVFIGIGMDEADMRRRLDACLLTEAGFAAGEAAWLALPDPFPRRALADPPDGGD